MRLPSVMKKLIIGSLLREIRACSVRSTVVILRTAALVKLYKEIFTRDFEQLALKIVIGRLSSLTVECLSLIFITRDAPSSDIGTRDNCMRFFCTSMQMP